MSSEFDLIEHYFKRPAPQTALGIGDDAALIQLTQGHQLAVSTDMLVAGTHFFADAPPYAIGWKALAVNLSDMAAMGAKPKWVTLALALPEANHGWLTEFSRGFFDCAAQFQVDLIGGDTTKGPLNICVQIMGEVPAQQALRRDGAQDGDEVWVSGPLGDAALALAAMQNRLQIAPADLALCRPALETPQPRVALGLALRGLATSAIDLSDGLLADLGHLLNASHRQATLYYPRIPISAVFDHYRQKNGIDQWLITSGDDYELCFTAPAHYHQQIAAIGQSLQLNLSAIGLVHAANPQNALITVYDHAHQIMPQMGAGYDHFA